MNFHQTIASKIVSLNHLTEEINRLRHTDRPPVVVFTNGCFDLVHQGHVDYLSRARDLGDLLVVGLNTDASVSRLKGPSRPISSQQSRAWVLAAFSFVDYVVLFDDPTPLRLIETLVPDILVKGADYDRSQVVGADFVETHGGHVALLPLVEGQSTTNLVNRMKQ